MQGPFLILSSEQKLRIIVPKPVPLDFLGSLTLSCWAPFHEISLRKDMSCIFIPQVRSLPQVSRRTKGDEGKNEKSSLLRCRQGEKSKETLISAITTARTSNLERQSCACVWLSTTLRWHTGDWMSVQPHTINFGSKWRWSASYLSRLTPGNRAISTLSAFTFKDLEVWNEPSIMKALCSLEKSVTN